MKMKEKNREEKVHLVVRSTPRRQLMVSSWIGIRLPHLVDGR